MKKTHVLCLGYIFWILGFMGLHRFYYNSKKMGLLYLLTGGLLGLGWLVDLFYLPTLHRKFVATETFTEGEANYSITWLLFVCGGLFGLHKLYLQRMSVFVFYFFTFGGFGIGLIYDLFTLNKQVAFFNLSKEK